MTATVLEPRPPGRTPRAGEMQVSDDARPLRTARSRFWFRWSRFESWRRSGRSGWVLVITAPGVAATGDGNGPAPTARRRDGRARHAWRRPPHRRLIMAFLPCLAPASGAAPMPVGVAYQGQVGPSTHRSRRRHIDISIAWGMPGNSTGSLHDWRGRWRTISSGQHERHGQHSLTALPGSAHIVPPLGRATRPPTRVLVLA